MNVYRVTYEAWSPDKKNEFGGWNVTQDITITAPDAEAAIAKGKRTIRKQPGGKRLESVTITEVAKRDTLDE